MCNTVIVDATRYPLCGQATNAPCKSMDHRPEAAALLVQSDLNFSLGQVQHEIRPRETSSLDGNAAGLEMRTTLFSGQPEVTGHSFMQQYGQARRRHNSCLAIGMQVRLPCAVVFLA